MDERLDLLCGHFAVAPPHDRLLRSYLPPRLVVHAGAQAGQKETAAQLAGLVSLMRSESADRSDIVLMTQGDIECSLLWRTIRAHAPQM